MRYLLALAMVCAAATAFAADGDRIQIGRGIWMVEQCIDASEDVACGMGPMGGPQHCPGPADWPQECTFHVERDDAPDKRR